MYIQTMIKIIEHVKKSISAYRNIWNYNTKLKLEKPYKYMSYIQFDENNIKFKMYLLVLRATRPYIF